MNVKEIIKAYLKENKFDGLVNQDGECACETEDLFPCCEEVGECEAGHKVKCDGISCGGECNWHMKTEDAIKIDAVANLLGFVGIDIEWRHY